MPDASRKDVTFILHIRACAGPWQHQGPFIMPAIWRTVRVFLSSTFRDMHAERDHLVKVVFPTLREKLEPYRVHLVDIDLRWGVTREQAENDQVLELCLRLIDECRSSRSTVSRVRF